MIKIKSLLGYGKYNMNKTFIIIAGALALGPISSFAKSPLFSLQEGDGFKRFSVSVGALYVSPLGKAQPIKNYTAIKNGYVSQNGEISVQAIKDNLNPSFTPPAGLDGLLGIASAGNNGKVRASLSGTSTINGLEQWTSADTGLEADQVLTLGIMSNYHFTDNISFEMKAGFPPKVDIKGKGQIYSPFSAISTGAVTLDMKKDLLITDLSKHGKAAEARAWTPAFEFQYHFGKTGVNKFRPYVGAGLLFAYFNELKLNPGLEQDLIDAGHMIANIKNNQAGASLDREKSSANPVVKLEAHSAVAPVITAGFTYDFNDRWFGVASISYAHLKGESEITVTDEQLGELVRSTSEIEITPALGYAGIGYRF